MVTSGEQMLGQAWDRHPVLLPNTTQQLREKEGKLCGWAPEALRFCPAPAASIGSRDGRAPRETHRLPPEKRH